MFGSYNANRSYEVDINRFSAITQTQAGPNVSERYKFIPTTQALSVLADYGWKPASAMQARTRKVENLGFQRHALRLVNSNIPSSLGVTPQILLTNSHSGTSAFELSLAFFVQVCSNGLCVAKDKISAMRVTHRGYEDQNMASAIESLARAIPAKLEQVETFRSTKLSEEERIALAKAAIELRFDGEKYAVEPRHMLSTWRPQEKEPTLWNTFNVVQEKIIKGGVRQKGKEGQSLRSRKVSSITEDIRLNRGLWTLTEEMARIKAA